MTGIRIRVWKRLKTFHVRFFPILGDVRCIPQFDTLCSGSRQFRAKLGHSTDIELTFTAS